ncbi:substrate-binding periplasmic protein [Shewanella atlantica]|nr:transporter substrate-binding domain-containing protein [Shewanella atlantica]
MKKFHIFLFLMANLLMAAQGTAEGAELKFVTHDFPPFSHESGGTLSGAAIDIVRQTCSEIEISCPIELLPWKRSQFKVKRGQAQAMFVIGWNNKRDQWLTFSPPLLKTQYGFFVNRTNPLDYQSLSDLAGAKVGVLESSNTSDHLKKIRQQMIELNLDPITIQGIHDNKLVFKMLDNEGRNIEMIYSNRDVGNTVIAQYDLQNIRYAGPNEELYYYIGFGRKHADKDLVGRFNRGFIKLQQTGVIQSILAEYNLQSVDPD